MAKAGISFILAIVAIVVIYLMFLIPIIINSTITTLIRYAILFFGAFWLARA